MILFEVKNLVKYFGGLAAVNDLSFQVQKNEIFGLIGPNGSGKTTIFNLISSFHRVTSGTIHYKGQNITGLKTHKICKMGIGRTFQVVKPLGRLTVLDNVIAAAYSKASTKHEAQDMALETLEFCGLAHRKDVIAKSLPIGERKRLEITRAMATKPELLLLDETAAGLNPSELDEAIELIKKIRAKGVTIIIVEHIMKVIMTISNRIHAINFGQTIAEGTPQEVANIPAVIEAYLGEDYAHG
ncbi:MAG: ABC transporter ATP-binding protein [Deltaproteobacteria bacterium]|nr:ABC transporter ATP-binding protein [Deltaproteobacteria bacterium]MBW2199701.1 ABC transporter ATP-binding protein [Deltaproteobacteria bacterium]MBW2538116.1 ABC transporter ATP-binding protein [Deltaproteobacteria bacterium]